MQQFLSNIAYELRRSRRARRVRITVHPGGGVIVTVPVRVSLLVAEQFIASQKDWVLRATQKMKAVPVRMLQRGSVREYKALREQALRFAHERIMYLNKQYGFAVGRVTIRNQKTRWGSCSRQKNLSFNYRIVLLPPELADYLIIHELCHLQELNHSRNFWKLVALTCPEYKKLRRKLRSGL